MRFESSTKTVGVTKKFLNFCKDDQVNFKQNSQYPSKFIRFKLKEILAINNFLNLKLGVEHFFMRVYKSKV